MPIGQSVSLEPIPPHPPWVHGSPFFLADKIEPPELSSEGHVRTGPQGRSDGA
jgi:hypothetical protein